MAISVSSVIEKIQRRFPDCSAPVALEYINECHADILQQLPLVTATEDIAITAGVREYDIQETAIRVVAAEYVTGTGPNRNSLVATDIDYLNSEEPNWRKRGSGRPTRYYIYRSSTRNVIGLDPVPAIGTTGSYPIIRLHETIVTTLSAGDNLPIGLLTKDAYVYGSALRFAMDHREYQGEIPILKSFYDEAIARERKTFDEIHGGYRRRYSPSGISMGGVS